MKNIFTEFAYNTEDAETNFRLALHYHEINQTASAFSHYYRCAERTTDDVLKYECLLQSYQCFMSQTNRDFTALHCLKQAICLLPERPEAYFLIAKHYENKKEWYECYTYCCIALTLCNFELPSLKTWVGYPGKYGLLFEKAVSGWWWDKTDETYDILKSLLSEYPNLPLEYKTVISCNLKNFFNKPRYKTFIPKKINLQKNIIDCFSFYSGYGEEMLELRYHILKDYVDYFVLCELNMTHTGKLIKQEAINLIKKLNLPREKFIIINLDLPDKDGLIVEEIDRLNCMNGNHVNEESLLSRVRERLQKDAVCQILDYFNEETVFIHSDLDEIINPEFLPWFAREARKNSKYIIKVPLIYLQGKANLRTYYKDTDIPAPWNDNLFLCLKEHLQNVGPTQIRSNKFTPYNIGYVTQNNEIVQDAGWHFSWMGNSNVKKIKQQSFIHYCDKFNFVVGGGYNSNEITEILTNSIKEGQIPPSGETDKILKSYDVNLLPKEIFDLKNVQNFLFDKK
jgi:tetratricopeptide (TPR) repeat protein